MAFSSRRPPPPFHHQRNGSFPNAPAPAPRSRTGASLQFRNTIDIFVTPHGHPAQSDSSSDDDAQPSSNLRTSRYRPTHSRSMSHPFPSLFASKKNKQLPSLDDSTDDDYPGPGQASARSSMALKSSRGPADFANGSCMTCGGRVRWPKELNVFRCTTCLTINDLKTFVPKPPEDGKAPEPPRPISLAQTKNLLHHCLVEALNTFAAPEGGSGSGRKLSNDAIPSHSPSHTPQDYFPKQPSPSRHGRSPSLGVPPPAHAYNPVFDDYGDGPCGPNSLNPSHLTPARAHSTSYPDSRSSFFHMGMRAREVERLDPRRVFKPVENYLVSRFGSFDSVNDSFVPRRQSISSRDQMHVKRKPVPALAPQHAPISQPAAARQEKGPAPEDPLVAELDAKLLLLGDLGENALWWTGSRPDAAYRSRSQRRDSNHPLPGVRAPRIEWGEAMAWYQTIIDAARPWTHIYNEAVENNRCRVLTSEEKQRFEAVLLEAQDHLQKALLKCTEMFLKRPGRVLKEARDVRFLLILLANPLLGPEQKGFTGDNQHSGKGKGVSTNQQDMHDERSGVARHSVIIKRILGLISHSSDQCHHQLVAWLSRLPEHLFLQIKDLVGSFVNYRIKRQSEKKVEAKVDITGGLIPEMSNNRAGNTPATLHAALAASSKKQKQKPEEPRIVYSEDWQLKAGAKVMSLVFAANNLTHVRRNEVSARHGHGHLLATSDFYNTMLDYLDFKMDFEAWESRKGKFSFCQYPFFLSIWAKIQILEFDARRQMHGKAREAFFDSILSHKSYNQYLFISVRRECLIEDSLTKVSEVVGSGSEDIKKGLRIEFQGEEGVDAGGLRKEWFQLLVREVFNPDHGLFVFDEDSRYCYFNPHTFETTDQYFLVGVVLGLAIHNSTILDVAFPPFAFRKLLAAAPASTASSSVHQRPVMTYTLDDLAEFRPRLASGLRQLLEYEGDVESTFCLDFAIEVDKYGARSQVPLCWGGEKMAVTNANRREYVDLYVKYVLDDSVKRQFEPFKRGFFTVCAGNALSLFRPEEIELLVRGSDEPLDIRSLRAVAKYNNWDESKTETEPAGEATIDWFWDSFAAASPSDQRRLLSFITGSDRIPAMGAASLVIKLTCLGDDAGRFPTARTCFNVLNLYRCQTRERLESSLWTAVNESEGFGLK